ncbi:MAG TPA: Fe-S cluster assembly protein SufD, partial [Ginsengibacter sp.]
MDTINIEYLGDKFNQLQSANADGILSNIRKEGFKSFNKNGIPTLRNEEWRFTNVSNLFRKEYNLPKDNLEINTSDIDSIRLPGYANANELVFVNGRYIPELSVIRSAEKECIIIPLENAVKNEYRNLVNEHLGKSSLVIKDGIHALNTSFIYGGVFIHVNKNQILEHPVYLYHLSDTRNSHTLAQPRSLVYVDQSAKLQLIESFATIGSM